MSPICHSFSLLQGFRSAKSFSKFWCLIWKTVFPSSNFLKSTVLAKTNVFNSADREWWHIFCNKKKEKERKKCALVLGQGCCDPGMWQCRKKMSMGILRVSTDISLFFNMLLNKNFYTSLLTLLLNNFRYYKRPFFLSYEMDNMLQKYWKT